MPSWCPNPASTLVHRSISRTMDGAFDGERRRGHQSRGLAWDPCRPDILQLLETAEQKRVQPIYYGSNHSFLVTLDAGEAGRSLAVYKPTRGEYPLYDFPMGTLYRREVAAWLVDCLLEWGLVPPSLVSTGMHGVGSLQLFIESESDGELRLEELRRMALLDVIINNADRKGEHCLLGDHNKLWGIDHGLSFHAQGKLRTVLWHFAGSSIRADERAALKRLDGALRSLAEPAALQIKDLVSPTEWRALRERVDRLLHSGRFPDPRYKPIPYRW
jgi:hypothetical protein